MIIAGPLSPNSHLYSPTPIRPDPPTCVLVSPTYEQPRRTTEKKKYQCDSCLYAQQPPIMIIYPIVNAPILFQLFNKALPLLLYFLFFFHSIKDSYYMADRSSETIKVGSLFNPQHFSFLPSVVSTFNTSALGVSVSLMNNALQLV